MKKYVTKRSFYTDFNYIGIEGIHVDFNQFSEVKDYREVCLPYLFETLKGDPCVVVKLYELIIFYLNFFLEFIVIQIIV